MCKVSPAHRFQVVGFKLYNDTQAVGVLMHLPLTYKLIILPSIYLSGHVNLQFSTGILTHNNVILILSIFYGVTLFNCAQYH